MDTVGKIRRWHFRDHISIHELVRRTGLSRNTIRQYLRQTDKVPVYPARISPSKLDEYRAQLTAWLQADAQLPKAQRRSVKRLFEQLQALGFSGSYGRVAVSVKQAKAASGHASSNVFIPLHFAPGDAFQFDWSTEVVTLNGVATKLKVAQVRLSYSRALFIKAYHGESLEMLFDAHGSALQYFGGVPRRGIYDNMKTAVTKIERGKARVFNRHFLQMASHYLFEPVACTPASGWEKGQIENQVGNVREWVFVPRLSLANLTELNAHLLQRCNELNDTRAHPQQADKTLREMLNEERAALNPLPHPFDGSVEKITRVSSTSLVQYDKQKYSVPCEYVGHTVALRASAEHLDIYDSGQFVYRHERMFGVPRCHYCPWHYVKALERKPGALRNGAPFVDWVLPEPLQRVQHKLLQHDGGDRAFVQVLLAVQSVGLELVTVACELALDAHVVNVEHILNVVNRLHSTPHAEAIQTPAQLQLQHEPIADIARYDHLLECSKSSAKKLTQELSHAA